MAPKTDLIGVWCEGANPWDDQHTNGLTLTDVGGVATASGKVGTAGDFERLDSTELTRSDEALLSTGDINFTLAAWVHREAGAPNPNIGHKADEYGFLFSSAGAENRFRFYIGTDAVTVSATTFGAPALTTWYYVQAQHDATDNLVRIRVNDGAWDEQATGGTAPGDSAAEFCIGGVSGAGFWDGLINQYAFWKGLKSDVDLNAIYNSGNGLAFSEWDVAPANLIMADLRRQSAHYRH
jgi:hypothetical protein